MQHHDADPDRSAVQFADAPAAQRKASYVPPVIPMGLPHVVQYVTGSLLHMPGPFQLMADRMSRYANANGEVSIALEFLCKISDLGSKNTAKGYIDKLTAMARKGDLDSWALKYDLAPKTLKRQPWWHRHLRTATARAAAGRG